MFALNARYCSQLCLSAVPAEDNKLAQLLTIAQARLESLPYSRKLRQLIRNVHELREWWFILLPFLFWVGWRTYHTERRTILHQRASQQQNPHV